MIIFYDFEVFKHDWLVVFKSPQWEGYEVIVSDATALETFYKAHRQNIFTGYNNKSYDNYILKAIMSGLDPYDVSQQIIEQGWSGWQIEGIKRYPLIFIDLMAELISHPSLKTIEGNLGISIEESSVPFDIDRPLTVEEIQETAEYCKHDVDATERLFEERFNDYIKPKLMLIKEFGLSQSHVSKTMPQLAAEILGARKTERWDEFDFDLIDIIQINNQEILDYYMEEFFTYKPKLKIDINGVPHVFGYGGDHGALKKYHKKGKLLLLDVGSYYPTMAIKYGFQSRNCRNKNKYAEIYFQRLEYKKNKDPLSTPFKLVLNAALGAMKQQYNKLYDPKQNNQICITGQLLFVDLLEKLEGKCDLIQSNTDGILIDTEGYNIDEIFDVVEEWEDRTGMSLGLDVVAQVHQKDVNNYMIVKENGEVKARGGFLKYYNGGTFEQNSLTILDEAVFNFLTNGTPARDTIEQCTDLMKFQMICSRSGKYGETRLINTETGKYTVQNKVNRIFASKEKNNLKLHKMKKESPNAFPNSPDHTIIYNGSMDELEPAEDYLQHIDLEWYIDLAQKRIKDFY